jgi:hypothetical protein
MQDALVVVRADADHSIVVSHLTLNRLLARRLQLGVECITPLLRFRRTDEVEIKKADEKIQQPLCFTRLNVNNLSSGGVLRWVSGKVSYYSDRVKVLREMSGQLF